VLSRLLKLPSRAFAWLLRLFFHLLYQPMAFAYDGVAWLVSLGMWKQWVFSIVPEIEGRRVLEIGPGPGHLLEAMTRGGINCVGLDRSPQMARLARSRLRSSGENSIVVHGYAQIMPFQTACFDQAVATFPSDYLWDLEALREIRRVLAPGGSLLVLPVAWITGSGILHRLAAWLFRATGQAPDPETSRFTQEVITRMEQAGFRAQLSRKELQNSTLLILHAESQVGDSNPRTP
jgi:ubiquinone/menaquinone biosynthesis C-methylase UbiE